MPAVTEQFGVRPADLVAHAGHVEAVGDRVANAGSAGAAVRAGAGAYGQLCSMVPVLLNGLHDVLIDGIGVAAQSLRDTGGRLRTVAGEYEGVDDRRATLADGIRGGR